jgi:hypothetical protein
MKPVFLIGHLATAARHWLDPLTNEATLPDRADVQAVPSAAARWREAGNGATWNDRISGLLCRQEKIEPSDRAAKITHFLRQGQMIRTNRIGMKHQVMLDAPKERSSRSRRHLGLHPKTEPQRLTTQ